RRAPAHRRAPPRAHPRGGGRARRAPRGELRLARLPGRQGAECAPARPRGLRRRPPAAGERDPRHRHARLRARLPPPHQRGAGRVLPRRRLTATDNTLAFARALCHAFRTRPGAGPEEDAMKFSWFHLMPYRWLPPDFRDRYHSIWVDIPNRLYDPVKGHQLYNEYLDMLEYADQMGFDAIGVNEHHQKGYGMMPADNQMAATLDH